MSVEEFSLTQQDISALKKQAMKYYSENNVPVVMENALNTMFYDQPPDVYGYVANYFSKLAKPATVNKLSASPVIDCNGQQTIQVDVWCTVNNKAKQMCSSTIPRADIKLHLENNEQAEAQMQTSVMAAIQFINKELSRKLAGIDPLVQAKIDSEILSFIALETEKEEMKHASEADVLTLTDDKHRKSISKPKLVNPSTAKESKGGKESVPLAYVPDRPMESFLVGCEVAAAISQAVCIGAAASKNIPVYQHVAQLVNHERSTNEFRIPIPMVTIIQSGKSVSGKVICFKEFMILPGINVPVDKGVVMIQQIFHHVSKLLVTRQGPLAKLVNQTGALCPNLETVHQALDIILEAVHALGLTIGEDLHLAINGAGHESFDRDRGKYEIMAGQYKSPDDMVDFWWEIIKKYPSIVAVIDPIRGEDIEQWQNLCERVSENVFVIGDMFFERPGILREMKLPQHTSGAVMHTERMNTITDIIACAKKFKDLNNELVFSTNNGDITDTFIVDLAVGLNARFLKVGGPIRGEKTSKLNRLVQISKELVPPKEKEQGEDIKKRDSFQTSQTTEKIDTVNRPTQYDPSSSRSSESSYRKDILKGLALGERVKFYLKPHAPFIFPVIKKIQEPEIQQAQEKDVE